MADNLAPAGSSTYSSNTMYVGDGTWDANRNNFLLPNLVGLNFATMRYNGMGNRFAGLPQYHQIVTAHGVLAAITFLVVVPAAIFFARFYGRRPLWALRMHIYLQILTVGLATVVFTLGWFAVGPSRSLTNPHHGIGVAIYVLVLVQAIGGRWIYGKEKGKTRRKLPVKLVMHQWLGRATALLAIAQVPLGLTLYGSPRFTFVLYTLWMVFLVVLYFILSYRAMGPMVVLSEGIVEGSVIQERKKSRFGGMFGTLAAGAGAAAMLRGRRNRSSSRSRRDEVIPSRRGSGSYVEEEKYEQRRPAEGGMMHKLLKGAAIVGAGALAKNWYDKRQRRREDDDYSSVDPDTPSRHNRRRHDGSEISEESIEVHRMEEGRRHDHLPGPGGPVAAAAAAAAISAAERPTTPRPRPGRQQSFDSASYSYDSTLSPSRRPQENTHKLRNGLLGGLGLAWFTKKMSDRRGRKEQDRLDRLEEEERIEKERAARRAGSRYTGDGLPPRRHRPTYTESSLSSSVIDDPHAIRPGAIPPLPPAYVAGSSAAVAQSYSRHDVVESVSMPHAPPDPHGILRQEDSGSEQYMSAGGHPHRRHSSRRRREGEAAAAAAVAEASALAADEEARRRRHRSQSRGGRSVASPPVSVKVKMHGDPDRKVTLRRLTEQEAAAERRAGSRRRRADSLSSLSGTDVGDRRRYRRDGRERRDADERAAERMSASAIPSPGPAPPPPPPMMEPLSPPNPAFAKGRRPKDSAYYSGRPTAEGSSSAAYPLPTSVGSPDSHATWSGMSPSASQSRVGAGVSGAGSGGEDPAERSRRRRLERRQRGVGGSSGGGGGGGGDGKGTVEFS